MRCSLAGEELTLPVRLFEGVDLSRHLYNKAYMRSRLSSIVSHLVANQKSPAVLPFPHHYLCSFLSIS
jgi:hypothetical protein